MSKVDIQFFFQSQFDIITLESQGHVVTHLSGVPHRHAQVDSQCNPRVVKEADR